MKGGVRVLYITYDGVLEPLGQSQVLAYLRKLARDHTVHLLSWEKAQDWAETSRREGLQRELRAHGIRWTALRYHKRPTALATAWDISAGLLTGGVTALRHDIAVVHARSYVPAVIALGLKRLTGSRFLFDMRGFWADERVDGGLWPAGSRLYRTAKWFERRFLGSAEAVVSLTQAGVDALGEPPFPAQRLQLVEVIRTCADLSRFHPRPRAEGRPFTLAWVGSVGTWYLFEPALTAFRLLQLQRPDARLLILNRGEHAHIRERLAAHGVPDARVELKALPHDEVPQAMAAADAGVFFVKPAFSKRASAPTKMGEFLGSGVPCLGNAGVGDVEAILEGERVGVAVRDFDEPTLREAVERLVALADDGEARRRCVEVARRYFSLDDGVRAYDRLYRELADRGR